MQCPSAYIIIQNVQISEDKYNQPQHGEGTFINDHIYRTIMIILNVTFNNNTANRGSAMYITNNSSIKFQKKISRSLQGV